MSRIEWLTPDQFAGRVGEKFAMVVPEGPPLELRLAEVKESAEPGGSGPEGQERRQFSLLFRGPASPVMEQRSYRLDHAELGDLELFLVPVGADADGVEYEAAFA